MENHPRSVFVLSSKQEHYMKVKDDVLYIKDANLLHNVSCKRPISFVQSTMSKDDGAHANVASSLDYNVSIMM